MDYNPPIQNRKNEELLEIIESPENWHPHVVGIAQNELQKRGCSLAEQENKRTIRTNYRRRVESVNSKAAYTINEKILIVLFGPVLFFLFQDIFAFSSTEGAKKKNRQGFFYLLIGIIAWIIVIAWMLNTPNPLRH